eukprot:gb/GFBE01003645.1/.p1 GENE.gb/GFBE01003645.1/~~gb/GFBE01003645.1/.p1  ORF type:complete len:248 (+),score=24.40 gb/GFBE01003645.1/:1-744(+)
MVESHKQHPESRLTLISWLAVFSSMAVIAVTVCFLSSRHVPAASSRKLRAARGGNFTMFDRYTEVRIKEDLSFLRWKVSDGDVVRATDTLLVGFSQSTATVVEVKAGAHGVVLNRTLKGISQGWMPTQSADPDLLTFQTRGVLLKGSTIAVIGHPLAWSNHVKNVVAVLQLMSVILLAPVAYVLYRLIVHGTSWLGEARETAVYQQVQPRCTIETSSVLTFAKPASKEQRKSPTGLPRLARAAFAQV